MSNIQPYNDETTLSNIFLRRIRVPTEPSLGKFSSALLGIFIKHYHDKINELLNLRDKKMLEVNDFLTIKVPFEDLGVPIEKNIPRAKKYVEKHIKSVIGCPCIICDDNTKKYKYIPLLKYAEPNDNGCCTLLFNDVLLDHVLPKKEYGHYSSGIVEEIHEKNMYAGYIYEEALSWENLFNHGRNPFFIWTLSDIRKKFSFDNVVICEDGTNIKVTNINKQMRIDNLVRTFKRAVQVINDYHDTGKIRFWLDVEEITSGKKKPGRSPKNCFRFEIHREKRNVRIESFHDAVQQELQFDDVTDNVIILDNYYSIKKILSNKNVSPAKIDKIITQIKERETPDNNFSEIVLTKIKEVVSKNGKKDEKQWWYILRAVLWRDYQLGEPGKNDSMQVSDGWPDNLDEKIKLMQESFEVQDRVIREHPELSLTPEKVKSILGNEFRDYCLNTNPPKPLRDWRDATTLFFTVLNKSWFKKNLTYGNNGNNQAAGAAQSGNAADQAYDYFIRQGGQGVI